MIGQRISHYEITECVSEGEMATVYKAEDLSADRTVAIKMVKPSHHDPKLVTKRFLREAESIAQIDHPNVVTLYEVVQKGDLNFLVMQFVRGSSLGKLMARREVSVTDAVRIACEVAAGLGAAHKLGVVHRDVKPDNIMIDEHGGAKVVDFGVARMVDRSHSSPPKRRLIGTLLYMAPEQLRGKDVGVRVDVYALGVVLFEMLTGRLPFESEEETALFYQIMNVDPPAASGIVPGIPKGVDNIIGKAMAKNPARRYRSGDHMLRGLKKIH